VVYHHKTERAEYDYKILSMDDRRQRASIEKTLFQENSASEPLYVLPEAWFAQWKKFIFNASAPPESINNLPLYNALVKEKKEMKEGVDYHLITKE
jgi:ketopantoate reductase